MSYNPVALVWKINERQSTSPMLQWLDANHGVGDNHMATTNEATIKSEIMGKRGTTLVVAAVRQRDTIEGWATITRVEEIKKVPKMRCFHVYIPPLIKLTLKPKRITVG
jgi:hypothetical protein